jgi:hypothetical protein
MGEARPQQDDGGDEVGPDNSAGVDVSWQHFEGLRWRTFRAQRACSCFSPFRAMSRGR